MGKVLVMCSGICLTVGMAFGQQGPSAVPDEIFYNGRIITVDSAFHIQEAFAVKGEQFLAVGTNASMKAMAGPKTRLIDLRSRAVIPGFMDSYNHQYDAGVFQLHGVQLFGVRSLAEMLERIRQAVATAQPGETVFTAGAWSEAIFPEKRGPTRQDLDQVSLDHPIVVFRSRSALTMNSAALKFSGISRETQSFMGDPVPKDASGEPTGFFTGEPAHVVSRKIVPPPPQEKQEQLILKIQERQHALGLTSIRESSLYPEGMRAYWRLWRDSKLTMRVSMCLDVSATEVDKLDEILSPWGVGSGFGDHRLRMDCVDGLSISWGGNAYLREPYVNRPGNDIGALRVTPEEIRQAVMTINRYGWRLGIYPPGDRTLDVVLDAYEAANAQSSIQAKRWSVERIRLVHPDQMERMGRLGVLVDAQPEAYFNLEKLILPWGKERADRVPPMRELLDHRLIVSTGSNWAGEEPMNSSELLVTNNPFVWIYFYVTRKTVDGKLSGASQKISREEALRVSTINGAYMTFEEEVKGSIEPGKLADFLILSQDILTVPEERIRDIHPLATYVGGRRVFSSKEAGF